MKRDVDLARGLLLEIEGRGADCSASILKSGPNHEADERIRYHLRLLVDAGLLKEVDRAANGVPCLRLTDAGHELVELSRSPRRWRQAKNQCHARTGGLSLIVIRHLLLRWALASAPVVRRRPRFEPLYDLAADPREVAPEIPLEPYDELKWDDPAADVRYVRVRPEGRNGCGRPAWEANGVGETEFDALPDYLL